MDQPLVLVADDNEGNRLLALDALEGEGFRVVTCDDGDAALAALEREAPDLLLLDVRMPGTDGIEVCRRLRARGDTTPILILTALRDIDTFEDALAAGADDYLTKPVRPAELIVRVRAALKVRRMSSELQQQYETLRQQRDELLRLTLLRERLIAFVVHDLKNPVNSIDLQAQVVADEPNLPEGAIEGIRHIRAEARVLTRMIANLLDLSKSDEGKLLPYHTEVDLHAMLEELFDELGPEAQRHDVDLEAQLEISTVRADRELLRRMIANLIDNGIRHTTTGTCVEVRSALVGDDVRIEVQDAGPGVPESVRPRLFEAYVQADDDVRRARRGRGLGLTFCARAAQAHGGRIEVECPEGGGSIFRLWLPNAART